MQILIFTLGSLLFGASLFLSLKLLDRYNSRNTIGLAAALGVIFSGAGMMGAGLAMLPLIALMYLLINYYGLGLLRSAGVIASMIGMHLALTEVLMRLS